MSTEAPPKKEPSIETSESLPNVRIQASYKKLDFATLFGFIFTFGFIAGAILIGQSNANFFNVPSVLIVLFGTMAATAISYTGEELARSGSIITSCLFRRIQSPSETAKTMLDMSVIAKKKGILALSTHDAEMRKDPFLHKTMQMVIDGYPPQDIERMLTLQIDAQAARHKRSASITRRASEIAPAMGLIGTLVGLVQMLADLENPDTIGPAMAVALLTTFYGAILGTIVMAPLAVKLEKNSDDETLIKTLIAMTAVSIAKQENPRTLEIQLNSELPPLERIIYFD